MKSGFRRLPGLALLALLAPALFVAAAELAARASGAGYPTAFLRRIQAGRAEAWAGNPFFGYRFFPARAARNPAPMAIAGRPEPGVTRVAVLGESAAMGDPVIEFSLARALDTHLNPRGERRRFEVLNAAMTAVNSHVIVEIAGDLARRGTDIFVLYLGNNEVVGPHGPGTAFAGARAGFPPSWQVAASRLRLSSWLRDLAARRLPGAHAWGGMAMFDQNRIPADDPRLGRVYRRLERNIECILAMARRRNIRVVLCTVAVNLTDCAPFASAQGTPPASGPWVEWDGFIRTGRRDLQEKRWADAAEAFARAVELDPGHAESVFQFARARRALGDEEAARSLFARARDLDLQRFRADSPINEVIRRAGRRDGLAFVDLERLFEEADDGDSFLDHVHFSEAGLHRASAAIARAIGRWFGPIAPLSVEELAARMLRSPWSGRREAAVMLARRSRPPFLTQSGNAGARARLAHRIEQENARIADADLAAWRARAEQLMRESPHDRELVLLWGHILCTEDRWADGAARLEEYIAAYPGYTDAHGLAALARAMSGDPERAAATLASAGPPHGYYLSQAALQAADAMRAEQRDDLAERFLRALLDTATRFPDRAALEDNLSRNRTPTGRKDSIPAR